MPFRRWRSFYACEHIGARDWFGSSKCLAQPWRSAFVLGTSTCRDNVGTCFGTTDYVSVWCCDQISMNHKYIIWYIWFFGPFFEVIDSWLETCGIHWELVGIGHSCRSAELNLLGTLATWIFRYYIVQISKRPVSPAPYSRCLSNQRIPIQNILDLIHCRID